VSDQAMVRVSRTDGKSESFLLDTSDTLDRERVFLEGKGIMTDDDAFLFQGTSGIDRGQEPSISLDKILKDNVLTIGEPTDTSPIVGTDDGTARYNQMRPEQRKAVFDNIQIWRGLTFTKDGFGKTFKNVCSWTSGYAPAANTPRVNTELTSNYSFSKVTHDLHVFGSQSTSVSFSSPYASGEAEYKTEKSKDTSSSQVNEYLVTRYIVRKVMLQVDPSSLVASPDFLKAVKQVTDNKDDADNIQGYYDLIKALDVWGYYVPIEFTLGGVVYSTDSTKISDFSEAESAKQEFNGSFKAEFNGIGGGAAYKNASGSDTKTTTSTKFQDITLQLIGGTEGLEKDFPKWAESLKPAINWALADATKLYPTLVLLASTDAGRDALTTAIKLIERYSSHPKAHEAQPYLDMQAYNTAIQELVNPFG
jgi:hypothetical protein